MWASKTSCLYNRDFTRFGRFPTSRTQSARRPYNAIFVALAAASEREPTTIPSAVTPLACRMKTSIQPMSGADLGASVWGNVWLILKAAKEQSRSLPTPKCHSRYIIPACIFFIVALQLCPRRHPSPALKSSSMVQCSRWQRVGKEKVPRHGDTELRFDLI